MRGSNGPTFEDQGFGRGLIEQPAPVLCIGCKKADPEDGCDHCDACLKQLEAEAPELVTNRTGAYLRFHADMEQNTAPAPGDTAPVAAAAPVETFLDVMLNVAQVGGFENIKLHPAMTMADAGEIAKKLSTETDSVEIHAKWVNAKLVVEFHRVPRLQGLEAILQAGSDAPLSFLSRRQAS